MSLTTSGVGSTRENPKPGLTKGTCVGVYDIGSQADLYKPGQHKAQVIVVWKLPDQTMVVDGNTVPMNQAKFYTNSIYDGSGEGSESGLHKDLVSWRGRRFTDAEIKAFRLHNILGNHCMLNIVEKKDNGVKIDSVMADPEGKAKKADGLCYWDMDNPAENWESVPDWVKKFVRKSKEWETIAKFLPGEQADQAPAQPATAQPVEEDEVPF